MPNYLCPNCRKQLSKIKDRPKDYFCFHCHTPVALVDDDTILFTEPGNLEHAVRASIQVIVEPELA